MTIQSPPPTKHETLCACETIIKTVDRHAKEIEHRWGIGRLPHLVPIEWAERFSSQQRKFSAAAWEFDEAEVRKHGDAMIRAYAKLEEVATAAGHRPGPSEQWEFSLPDGTVVILVRDIARVAQADTGGRQAAVWSLDEVASVIAHHPALAKAKEIFPGAVLETIRPDKRVYGRLDDELAEVPFA